jgi:thioredoxin 1
MKKLLYFTASWCAPCQFFTPIFESFKKNNPDIEFSKLDVDINNSLVLKYDIKSVPTLVFLDNDIEFARLSGAQTELKIKNTFLKIKG